MGHENGGWMNSDQRDSLERGKRSNQLRRPNVSELRLVEVWYIQHGNGNVTGWFRSDAEAERRSDTQTGERYIRKGWLATVDGETGYLVSHLDPLKVQ